MVKLSEIGNFIKRYKSLLVYVIAPLLAGIIPIAIDTKVKYCIKKLSISNSQ